MAKEIKPKIESLSKPIRVGYPTEQDDIYSFIGILTTDIYKDLDQIKYNYKIFKLTVMIVWLLSVAILCGYLD